MVNKTMANRENALESTHFISIGVDNLERTTFYIQSISIFYKERRLFIIHVFDFSSEEYKFLFL